MQVAIKVLGNNSMSPRELDALRKEVRGDVGLCHACRAVAAAPAASRP